MIVLDGPQPQGVTPRAGALPEEPDEGPSAFGRLLPTGAREPGYIEEAFRLESTVTNAFDVLSRPVFEPEPDHTPLDVIKDTPYESNYLDNFIGSRSEAETRSIMSRIDREEQARETVNRAGLPGMVAAMAAGVLDPTTLVPAAGYWKLGMSATRAARTGVRAAEAAAIAGGVVAGQEAVLQGAQETRTSMESLFNIGAATFAGGVLGGAVGLLSRADLDRIAESVNVGLPVTRAEEAAMFDKAVSAGAAATDAARGTGELKGAAGAEKAFSFQDPLIRLQTSSFPAARSAVRDLAETPLTLAENAEGIATTIGGSVETQVKMAEAPLAEAMADMDRAFADYFFGGKTRLAGVRAGIARMTGRSNKMSYAEFKEQVWEALLAGDSHSIPEVQKAASSLRSRVFDPLKDEAIELRLLPSDVKPLDDVGYVPRLYNTEAIRARRAEFVEILSRNFASRQKEMMERLDDLEARTGADGPVKEFEELTEAEIRSVADQVTDTILANSPARVIMPADLVAGPRGPLKERVLRIPTTLIRDFVIRDPETLARRYTRTMAADIGLTRKFGSTDLAEQINKINDDAAKAGKDAKGEKASKRIAADQKAAIRDLSAIRDRIRGTYAIPDNPDGLLVRSGRVVRNLNYMRLLGGMTLSAVPDLARPVMVHGLTRVMRTAFVPFVRGLKTFKLAANEAKLSGTALDMVLDSRAMAIADVMDDYGRGSKFERGLTAATSKFGLVSLMAPWNAAMKQFVGVIAQSRMLQSIENVAAGKASKAEMEYLAAGGIDRNMAERIHRQFAGGEEFVPPAETAAVVPTPRVLPTPPPVVAPTPKPATADPAATKAAKGTAPRRPPSLFRFLAARGGIRDHGGELRHMELHKTFVPGFGRLVRKKGMPLDRAREAAAEAGYLSQIGNTDKAVAESIIDDLLEALRRESMGEKVYSEFDADDVARLDGDAGLAKQNDLAQAEIQTIAGEGLGPEIVARATELRVETGMSPEDALERAVMEDYYANGAPEPVLGADGEEIPFFDDPAERTGISPERDPFPPAGEGDGGRGDARDAGTGGDAVRGTSRQVAGHGVKDGEVWWANTEKWTDRQAVKSFRAFMVRDIDRTIVTPGQDKPLWMSTELGKVLGQFRSFNIASMQRTVIAGLQQRDMAALNGAMLMLSLGALSFYLKTVAAGLTLPDDPAQWAVEAFDRSGLAGWIMDANNIAEKVTRGRVGASAITGEMASRYASRNALGALLGPTFDMVGDAIQITGTGAAALRPQSDGDKWAAADTHALRKMIPLQNVFYIRRLFDAMERNVNATFGVPERRQ